MALNMSIVVLIAGLAACATLLQGCGSDGNKYKFTCDITVKGVKETMDVDCSSGKDGKITVTASGIKIGPTDMKGCGLVTEAAYKKTVKCEEKKDTAVPTPAPAVKKDTAPGFTCPMKEQKKKLPAGVKCTFTAICVGSDKNTGTMSCLDNGEKIPNMPDATTTSVMPEGTTCDQTTMDAQKAMVCASSELIMMEESHDWITTLLLAAASGAVGGLGVIAAVSWFVPRQAVQQSRLLG